MNEQVAYFLIEPNNRASFTAEINEIADDVLWDLFTHVQPTLALHSKPIFGTA